MNQDVATRMFEEAKLYVENNHSDELEWANSINVETFSSLEPKQFLTEYCWVIYASNFKVSTVEKIFQDLRESFKGFDIRALSKMNSIKSVLKIFNNERKANSFLNGSKAIASEGFSAFKKRLKKEGVDMLEQLPGIGPITKYHLAKNIGLVDAAKPDIWLVRAAEASETSVDELVKFLSKKYSMSRHSVDVVLWRYGADRGLGL